MLSKDNKEKIIQNSLDNLHIIENTGGNVEIKEEFSPLKNVNDDVNTEEIDYNEKQEKDEYIEPKQHDTLFWCLYIIEHGYNDYEQISRNYGVKELEEKQKIGEFVKKNASKIKNTNYKMTNIAIQEILSELMTVQKLTSIEVLIAMTVYYNINILLIDYKDKTMIEFWANKERIPSMDVLNDEDDAKTYILFKNELGKYKLQLENVGAAKIWDMQEKYIVLDHYNKPLKSIANYKVNELENMARKLKIFDENKKYKKAELYEEIGKNILS